MKKKFQPQITFYSFLIPFLTFILILGMAGSLIFQLKTSELKAARTVDAWDRLRSKTLGMFLFNFSPEEREAITAKERDWLFIGEYRQHYLKEFDGMFSEFVEDLPKGLLGQKTVLRVDKAYRVWKFTEHKLLNSLDLFREILGSALGQKVIKLSYAEMIESFVTGEENVNFQAGDLLPFYRLQDSLSDLEVSGEVFSSVLDGLSDEINKKTTVLILIIILVSVLLSGGIIFLAFISLKSSEEALRLSEDRFRSLVETASDWIWEVDENSRYTYAGPKVREILGYEPHEMLGKTPFDFMPSHEAEMVKQKYQFYVSVAQPFYYLENINLHKHGYEIVLETSGVPILDKNGRLKGYRGIDREITGRKRAIEKERELSVIKAVAEVEKKRSAQLAEAYRNLQETQDKLIRSEKLAVLGELAGTIAHELRNPLGSIKNSSYFLKLKLGHFIKEKKIYKHFSILDNEINIADKIISDVLNFARVKEPMLERTKIDELLRNIIKQMKVPPEIEVQQDYQADDEMFLDQTQMRSTFFNLIQNAVQAMPQGGVLRVATFNEGSAGCVKISDTGEGIPSEDMEKIFEPLFSTKIRGTGLGLSICQSIVHAHRGKIQVESHVGRGTDFIVYLPKRMENFSEEPPNSF